MVKPSDSGDPNPNPNGSELPRPIYNWLSLFGMALAVISLTAVVFFVLIGLAAHEDSGYGGLTFLPPIGLAVLGSLLIVAGWLRERWRHKHGRHSSFLRRWVVDPSEVLRNTGWMVIFGAIVAGTFVLLGAGAGSVALVEFTESNVFCGEVCHAVMSPEATVYASSPHAQLKCVECHVGSGSDSYIRAKLNGLGQVYAVATGEIRRPIPTPIENRPHSDEICASCHAPDRFIGYKAVARSYFLTGEESEPRRLRMLVNVGGAHSLMKGSGIHYHMMFERKVEFIARDPKFQDIAWVRVTQPDGEIVEYTNEDDPLSESERESLEVRSMECVDCHNRPAHAFPSPVDSVNAALIAGSISTEVPYIKEGAVRALDAGYETQEQAMKGIEKNLLNFYEDEHPEVTNGNGAQMLKTSIAGIRDIYRNTIFPEMKADWSAHPDNIGHRESPGCFRCHNDTMISEEGEPIFTECSKCHSILAQGEEKLELTEDFDNGLAFVHPEDWETVEEFTLCSECHTGGADLYE